MKSPFRNSIKSCETASRRRNSSTGPKNIFYQNCTVVRAAGADPIRAGDPGWDTKFDRDGDGVGCE
ncbi:excalibur calcium-binding domain-containing protein [Jeotgalibaca ciconiae]|uniref:excalibur calcium-binding domain-containing protein n=1 Tax=Jeotgalibaca ciconiae TaxID=2496265 RepID=UPI001D131A87|nr:excalibur calcium-binding domain-containing protein [Jeotgalibaca ciconiae]